MKTPKFTDGHRFPRPYRQANSTDITRSFDAARKQQKQPSNVRILVRAAKRG